MATRVPYTDLKAAIAKEADITQVDVDKVMDALAIVLGQVFSRKGEQIVELPNIGTFEERIRQGTMPKELGGEKYKTPVVNFRGSSTLKAAAQGKSVKLLADREEALTTEEYDAIYQEAA